MKTQLAQNIWPRSCSRKIGPAVGRIKVRMIKKHRIASLLPRMGIGSDTEEEGYDKNSDITSRPDKLGLGSNEQAVHDLSEDDTTLPGMAAPVPKVSRWILDTGASNHMISKAALPRGTHIFESEKTIYVRAVNDVVPVNKRAYVRIPPLGCSVECIILDSTPAALSTGRLNATGFGFSWPIGKPPSLVDAEGAEVELTLHHYAP